MTAFSDFPPPRLDPLTVRHALHHVYAVTAIALMVTGLFLTLPDLRARVVGGYSREILDIHLWVGWLFLAVPFVALALTPRALIAELWGRLGPSQVSNWTRLHVTSVVVSGFLLGGSGVVLWLDPDMPRSVGDLVSRVHEIFSWYVIGELGFHLVAARRKTLARAGELLGLSPRKPADSDPEIELFEFADDD